jgi:hypothetical protein
MAGSACVQVVLGTSSPQLLKLIVGARKAATEYINSFLFKCTDSRDITFYFKGYKFKSALPVKPLMVFKFIYFIVL